MLNLSTTEYFKHVDTSLIPMDDVVGSVLSLDLNLIWDIPDIPILWKASTAQF